jgi:hypothetical protein
MQIVCIKIPENNPELFEINRKYNAYYIPIHFVNSLGFPDTKYEYWIYDCEKGNKIFCQVTNKNKNFVTIDEWRELQLNKIICK